jgi:dimethylglycine catabolism A
VLATGAAMLPPAWLPPDVTNAGMVPDLLTAITGLGSRMERQRGAAVLFDMDHSEGTYAAAEFLRARYDRVVIVTPRDTIATEVALVTRQGILRRMAEQGIETVVLAVPCWSEAVETGALEYRGIYGTGGGAIADLALLTYATPRVPAVSLAEELRAVGIEVRLIGDCRTPQGLLEATASGHAVGNAI